MRGEIAQIHIAVVKAVCLALSHCATLARLTKLASEARAVADVALHALVGAVDAVARKGCRAVGIEASALSSGDVAWVDNIFAAPAAEGLRNARLARRVG